MLIKLKQRLETWLRGIIATEVGRIDRDLQGERAALRAQIATFDGAFKAHFQSFENVVQHLSEVKENASLKEYLNEMRDRTAVLMDTVKKLHPSLKV